MALENLFNEQGKVVEARVIYDRDSGRSKGFGFVTLSSSQEVQKAINSLNGAVSIITSLLCIIIYSIGTSYCKYQISNSCVTFLKDLDGRQIRVSEAEARPPRGQF